MPEPLHPDLAPHVDGYSIDHPFIEVAGVEGWQGYFWPALYGRLNRLYARQREIEAGTYVSDDWDRYHPELSSFTERFERFIQECIGNPESADEVATSVECPKFQRLVGCWWTTAEMLTQCSSCFDLVMQYHSPIVHVMTGFERRYLSQLPQYVPVYRAHVESLQDGCCWYPSRAFALDWLGGIPGLKCLSSGVVARENIRAVFTRRGEVEFICRGVEKIRVENPA